MGLICVNSNNTVIESYSVEIVRKARHDLFGQAHITAEVSPHHLLLTEDHCVTYDTRFKMNPATF